MARADKAAAVAELATAFRDSQAAVLTEYRGLSVSDLSQLRTALGADVTYSVVKNTLTKIAAREAGLDGLDDLLVGPSAIAFVQGDPVEAAKGLRDFARTHPLLIIKGGVLDGATLTPAELTRLADLESREVLLAKLAGAMKASLSGAAALFQAPLAQAARTVEALRAKVEAEGPVATAAPAADAGGTSDVTDTAASSESADAGSADAGSADAGSADAGSADAGSAGTGSAGTESADGGSADDGSGATEAPADVVGPVVTTDEPVLTTDGPDAAATASSETPA